MKFQVLQNMLARAKQAQARLMEEQGRVLRPEVVASRHGVFLGSVELRDVVRGGDAVAAIAKMSRFPDAGGADEIMVAWDEVDLSVACGLEPANSSLRLNVLMATSEVHTVAELPYEVMMLPGSTDEGLPRARPRWLEATLTLCPELPVPMEMMLQLCFRPFPVHRPDVFAECVDDLRASGYTVTLPAPC